MLYYLLVLVIGILIGGIIVFFMSGRGCFELYEVEEDGVKYHNIRISLFPDQTILNKKLILLVRNDSLK